MRWEIAVLGCFAVALGASTETTVKVGDRLPSLQGEFLTGRKAVLPEASEGRVALLFLGFTYDSRWAVEAWAGKFRERFGKESRVTFYEVPVIGGLAKLGKWFIDSGMRKGTPKEDHEHVITVYSGSGEWKERMQYSDPKAAYIILLDRNGRVAWKYSGGFEDRAYESLASRVSELLTE